MESIGKKWQSVFLCFLMIFSSLAMVSVADKPEVIPPVRGDGIPDIQITNLRADAPVLYLYQNNRLILSVANKGNATALKVTANVTDVIPKVSEELITTLHLGALRPGMEKTCSACFLPGS